MCIYNYYLHYTYGTEESNWRNDYPDEDEWRSDKSSVDEMSSDNEFYRYQPIGKLGIALLYVLYILSCICT